MIPFYEKCCNNIYKNYFEDVKTELKNIKEDIKRKEKVKEKEDINNFNPKDVDIDIDDNKKEAEEVKIEENDGSDNNENEENRDNYNGDSYIDKGNDEEFDDDMDIY